MNDLEILIVSHGRPLWLKRTLVSVRAAIGAAAAKSPLHYRIRVLLNGVDSESANLLAQVAATSPDFEFIQHNETLGPAAARNWLASKARASTAWVLFLDDDCVIAEDFILKWQNIISTRATDAQVIGGPNLTFPTATGFEKASGKILASTFASMRSAWRYRETTSSFRCTDVELTSTHLFVKSEVLKSILYPETFQTAEENAFLHEVQKKFSNIYYFGELFVYHERRQSYRRFVWQIFRYGRGRGQMVRDGYAFEWFHIAPAVFVAVLVGSLFWPTDYLLFLIGAGVGAYISALVVASILARTLWGPLLFTSLHTAYVLGWWWGFIFRSSPKVLSHAAISSERQ